MIDLRLGDCLELMPTLEDESIDAVIADIPYGTTACSWDTVIPFAPMWEQLKRICKGAIVLFGSQPFTSALVMSNPNMFRYQWVWEKSKPTRWLDCKKKPLLAHEELTVFSVNGHVYHPQFVQGKPYNKGTRKQQTSDDVYGQFKSGQVLSSDGLRYPRSVVYFKTAESEGETFHKSQKPVALMEYLVRTYTNENDTVLDFTMGSGSTLVACINTNRNGIGMELRQDYFEIAQRRIAEAQLQMTMELEAA